MGAALVIVGASSDTHTQVLRLGKHTKAYIETLILLWSGKGLSAAVVQHKTQFAALLKSVGVSFRPTYTGGAVGLGLGLGLQQGHGNTEPIVVRLGFF